MMHRPCVFVKRGGRRPPCMTPREVCREASTKLPGQGTLLRFSATHLRL